MSEPTGEQVPDPVEKAAPVETPAVDDSAAQSDAIEKAPVKKSKKEKKKSGPVRALVETVVIIAVALAAAVLIRLFLVQAFYVPSGSMENTLLPSDRIVASKITTHFTGVQRGQVVVFKDPGGWLPAPGPAPSGFSGALHSLFTFVGLLPSDSGNDLVKRVIGVGGDRIVCCDKDGHIELNGKSLIEPYIKPGDTTDQVLFDVVVPKDSVFVMGDNRSNSRDSRYHLRVNDGGVPVSDVVGNVFVTVWPLSRFSFMSIPDTFSDIPSAP
jgi:signal peptidase I